MTSSGPGKPVGYHSTIAELGRDLLTASIQEHSREAQVVALDAIANECGREALRLHPTNSGERKRMGLYDDQMVIYELLNQGWGHWLYSGNKTPDSTDEQLARSVVQVTLATCLICPYYDLNGRASEAIASHCGTFTGRQLVYPALKEIIEIVDPIPWSLLPRKRLAEKWHLPITGMSRESAENLKDIFDCIGGPDSIADKSALGRDRSQWSFDEGLWSFRKPQEHTAEQQGRSDQETLAIPPLSPLAVGRGGLRQAMMLHAILGPTLTEDLIRAVSASGMQDGTLVELTADLEELRVGKYPEMLLLMASAAHATAIADGWPHLEKSFPLLGGGYGPATKYLGYEVVEALQRFGVDPSGDREGYNRWLHSAVKDSRFSAEHGILTGWDIPPELEEDESESEASVKVDNRPRRKPRLMDYVNRAAARSARSLAARMRSRGTRGNC
mgnify:FL=1